MSEQSTQPVTAEVNAEEYTPTATSDGAFGDAPAEQPVDRPAPETEAAPENSEEEEQAARQLNERLADEFCVLCREIPGITRVDDLPDAVMQMAVEQGLSLFDAYLRHRFYEERRIGEAERAEQTAVAVSTGSLAAPPTDPHPEVDAFVTELRRSLR